MSIPVNFNNQEIVEPGVYARITSGEPVRPITFPFGGVAIIDTGNFSGWGGGSGISGALKSGKEAIYTFENPNDFRAFVKGGEMFLFSRYLFNPSAGANGPSQVSVIRACTTTPASITKTFGNGQFVAKAKNEGRVGNAVYDEKRAMAYIVINQTTLIEDNTVALAFKNGATNLQTIAYTVDEEVSMLSNLTKIAEIINAGSAGFKAEVFPNRLLVYAPEGTGTAANAYSVANTGTVQLSTLQTFNFAGGVEGTKLLKGYTMEITEAPIDDTKFVASFYLGTFKGKTASGFNYGETDETNSTPILLAQSPEIGTVDELIFWAKNDYAFKQSFVVDELESYVNNVTNPIQDADISKIKAVGGTEIYNPADLDLALEYMREFQNTFFISDRHGAEARSVQNAKILQSINTGSTFEKMLIIGLGKDETEFEGESTSSIEVAKFYDSEAVIGVHSGALLVDPISNVEEKFSALLTAFNVAGRLGGQEAQEPITFKTLALENFLHIPSVNQRKRALQAGVLHVRDVDGIGNVVHQGVNTTQKNKTLFNADGTSYEISIKSIKSQLNKELILNLRPLFVGVSRGRVTEADVKTNVEAYLMSKTATDTIDNLIIKFKGVTVRRIQDRFDVTYSFEPNGPINKLLLTGFMYDSNL